MNVVIMRLRFLLRPSAALLSSLDESLATTSRGGAHAHKEKPHNSDPRPQHTILRDMLECIVCVFVYWEGGNITVRCVHNNWMPNCAGEPSVAATQCTLCWSCSPGGTSNLIEATTNRPSGTSNSIQATTNHPGPRAARPTQKGDHFIQATTSLHLTVRLKSWLVTYPRRSCCRAGSTPRVPCRPPCPH